MSLLWASVASISAAQGTATAYVQTPSTVCGQTTTSPNLNGASCTFGNGSTHIVHGNVTASAIDGILRVSSNVNLLEPNGGSLSVRAIGSANWTDVLSFSGVRPAVVRFMAHVHGNQAGHVGSANSAFNASSGFAIRSTLIPHGLSYGAANIFPFAAIGSVFEPVVVKTGSVSQFFTFDVPVLATATSIDLFMQLWGYSTASSNNLSRPIDASLDQNFSSTAQLVELRAFDSFGVDITGSAGLTWKNGTIVRSTTTVPEPSTIVMLIWGALIPCLRIVWRGAVPLLRR